MACLPKRITLTGYGPLRTHYRVVHNGKNMTQAMSNLHRFDGGYIHDGNHYFPGDAGFEPWRAVGYGTSPPPPPVSNRNTENSRGINITSVELTTILETVLTSVQKQINTGVQSTLQGAGSILSMVNETNDTRSFFPVPSSNNVLVSIQNPVARQAPIQMTNENAPPAILPAKNYYTTDKGTILYETRMKQKSHTIQL